MQEKINKGNKEVIKNEKINKGYKQPITDYSAGLNGQL